MKHYHYYLITIKAYAKDDATFDNLVKTMYMFNKRVRKCHLISDIHYEMDSFNRIHAHFIVQRVLSIAKVKQVINAHHVHCQEFSEEDYDKVVNYISKDGLTSLGAELISKMSHNHMDSF